MPNFAIHDGNAVVNVILAESKDIAEQVTGMQAIPTSGQPWIGWTLVDGVWVAPVTIAPEVADEQGA